MNQANQGTKLCRKAPKSWSQTPTKWVERMCACAGADAVLGGRGQASVNPKAETVEDLLERRRNLHVGMLKLAREDLTFHLQASMDAFKVPPSNPPRASFLQPGPAVQWASIIVMGSRATPLACGAALYTRQKLLVCHGSLVARMAQPSAIRATGCPC